MANLYFFFATLSRSLRRMPLSEWLLMLMIAIGIGVVWHQVFQAEQAAERIRLGTHADQIEVAIKDSAIRAKELLAANASFHYASDDVTAEEFAEFNHELMPAVPAVFQFQWLAWVSGADRTAYEAARRKAGLPDYFIYEPVGKADRRPASERDAHLVIHHSLAKGDHLSSIGLDVLFTAEREARYRKSMQQNSLLVSPVIPVYANRITPAGPVSNLLPGIVVTTPVYRTRAASNDIALRASNIRGFITAVIDVEEMLRLAIDPLLSSGFEVLVAQADQHLEWRLLSRRSLHTKPMTELSQEVLLPSATDIVRKPTVVDRPLMLVLRPGESSFLAVHLQSALYLVLGTAFLLLTMALLISFRNQTERRHQALEQKRLLDESARQNSLLESRVAERTSALSEANLKLQAALESLALTQVELVRSEKLAALGNLVAGIAHELNTPIGNSVMVASTLTADRLRYDEEVAGGTLRKSSLMDFLSRTRQACDLLERNLERAATLIANFKQLAVDQTSERRRSFKLAQMVHDTLSTLQPVFRHTHLTIEVDVSPDIAMNSFPGPLGQVLINLIENARLHAFDQDAVGTVRIVGTADSNQIVHLHVSDNGRGMTPDILPRIFDPFFTTRLGQGGSGLGLHLVYGMVTRNLGGRVHVCSEPGAGTTFMLELPMLAPEPVAEDKAGNKPASRP